MLKKFIFFIFLISSAIPAHAAATTELATLLNHIKSMQANFTQVIYDNRHVSIQQSQGEMALSRPGKFRWEVKKPIPQLIIANDQRLWIYDPDLDQVTIRSLDKTQGETPGLLLSHTNQVLEKDFTIRVVNIKNSDLNWYELIPKRADSMFATIKMGFLHEQIQEMRLEDHLGHTTLIQFNHVKVNKNLLSSLFVFNINKDVDVIDETKAR